jgi:hypothetical protein
MREKANRGWHFDPNHLTVRDVLIIVPIVLFLSVLGIVFASQVSHDTYIRWGGLGLVTAVMFAIFVYDSRALLRVRRFWIATVVLLTIHLAIWILFLSHVGEWKLAWFLIMILEAPALVYLRDWRGWIKS